jgi:hypothetical protein
VIHRAFLEMTSPLLQPARDRILWLFANPGQQGGAEQHAEKGLGWEYSALDPLLEGPGGKAGLKSLFGSKAV